MIIGLAGAKRSGKNTVAGFIADHFSKDYEITEWSFAEDLKIGAAAALGFENDEINSAILFCDSLKEDGEVIIRTGDGFNWSISGREYLQYYGTEAHRDVFGSEFWVDNTIDKIPYNNPQDDYELWEDRLDIITDVRFPNEAEAIRRKYGYVVRITRPDKNSTDTHASEKPLPIPLVDLEIYNNRGLSELEDRVISQLGILIRNDTRGQIG